MHKTKRKKYFLLSCILVFILMLSSGCSKNLRVTKYTHSSPSLPEAFDGFRIAFLSDLHCKEFGENQQALLHAIDLMKPNLIVFTGDMIDKKHTDLTPISDLLEGLSSSYPIYAVTGNHEYDSSELYQQLMSLYDTHHVTLLEDEGILFSYHNSQIGIYGMSFSSSALTEPVDLLAPDKNLADFNILLCHDSNLFEKTSKLGYDLVLSGHVHGGVIRIPFIGGLLNTNGTFFPHYDYGKIVENNSTLISSAGLGDAVIPRINNAPELVLITLIK